MYSKGGGKFGKHGAVIQADNISALSFAGVQVFQSVQASTRTFGAVTDATALLRTFQFAHISAIEIMSVLFQTTLRGDTVEISQEDTTLLKKLQTERSKLMLAVQDFRKRRREAGDDED